MMKSIKSIYNKDNCDYSKGIVDPLEFHPTFYFFLKAFRVLDSDHLPKWTYFTQAVIIINTTIAFALSLLAMFYGISTLDILQTTEGGSYCIVLCYELLMMFSTKINLPHFHNLQRSIREDFHYVCTSRQKYRKRFFETQLATYKICLSTVIFLSGTVLNMVLFSICLLVYISLTYKPEEGIERTKLLPFWAFNINFSESPIYEISFIYAGYSIFLYGFAYIFMIQTGIVWVRQITTKADLIIYCLQDLLEDIHTATNLEEQIRNNNLIKLRMRKIIKQHHSMYSLLQDFAGAYKKLLMYEQKFSGPVVCMTAYGASEKLATGEIQGILILLCISGIAVCFIPSYLCTFLGIKIRSICDACWDVKFWKAGPIIRPYMVLIMQRSLRPLPLQAPGFADISLQTFSSNMAGAYSLFNMLRQANMQFDK